MIFLPFKCGHIVRKFNKCVFFQVRIQLTAVYLLVSAAPALAESKETCSSLDLLNSTLVSLHELRSDEKSPSDPLLVDTRDRFIQLKQTQFTALEQDFAAPVIQNYIANFERALWAFENGASPSIFNAVLPAGFGAQLASLQREYKCGSQSEAHQPVATYAASFPSRLIAGTGDLKDTNLQPAADAGNGSRQSSPPRRTAQETTKLSTNTLMRSENWWPVTIGLGLTSVAVLVAFSRLTRTHQKRRIKRHFVYVNTQVRLGRSPVQVTVVDISPTGMKLRHGGDILKRSKVKFRIGGEDWLGKVRWHNEAFAGVSFNRPLPESLLFSFLQKDAGALNF